MPSTIARSRVKHLVSANKRLIDMLAYAYEIGLCDAASALNSRVKHRYWRAGEVDCPRDIKAPNGELHTHRCKVCGLDNPRHGRCQLVAALGESK